MFDPGFTEVVLLFVIALLILGPERLPRVASQIGRWVGRARRMASQLRHQLEREVALEQMTKSRKNQKPRERGDASTPESGRPDASDAPGSGPESRAASGSSGPAADDAGASPESATGSDGDAAAPDEPTERKRTDESTSA